MRGYTVEELCFSLQRLQRNIAELSSDAFASSSDNSSNNDCSATTSRNNNIALDIDETLAATNVAWFERCIALFGISLEEDTNLSTNELIEKYHLAQNNPSWYTAEAQDWMHEQRTSPTAQEDLPIIPGALEGVNELLMSPSEQVNLVAYITVRPRSVNANTVSWLQKCGFPDLPVVAKPNDVPFEDGNKWKARALHQLWKHVTGIIDDNPKLAKLVGSNYPGKIYLYGKDKVQEEYRWAIPCPTWKDVVNNVLLQKP